jgi:hypothetical protein
MSVGVERRAAEAEPKQPAEQAEVNPPQAVEKFEKI